jgi:hypothetical protein
MNNLCDLLKKKINSYSNLGINIKHISDTNIDEEAEFKLIDYIVNNNYLNKKDTVVVSPDADFINIFLIRNIG